MFCHPCVHSGCAISSLEYLHNAGCKVILATTVWTGPQILSELDHLPHSVTVPVQAPSWISLPLLGLLHSVTSPFCHNASQMCTGLTLECVFVSCLDWDYIFEPEMRCYSQWIFLAIQAASILQVMLIMISELSKVLSAGLNHFEVVSSLRG